MNKVFFIVFIVISTLFLIRYFIVGQAVYGDGLNYWSNTHSIYFDFDLDTSNQLSHFFTPESNNSSGLPVSQENKNYIEYRYPPLASLMFLPAFAFADLFILLTQPLFNLTRNGFSDIYQITVGLFNTLLVTLGLFILYKTLIIYFKKGVGLLTIIAIFFSTNLLYYGSLDIINSHPTSFLLSTIYLTYLLKYLKFKRLQFILILGILSGLLAATRTQDALFLVLSLLSVFYVNKQNYKTILFIIKSIILVLVGFTIGFLPQIAYWVIVYGAIFKNAYASTPGSFNFLSPHLVELITFSKTGILYYSPIIIIAFLGLVIFARKYVLTGVVLIIFVVFQYYLIASWDAWHQGESYGVRMLISTYPMLAFGLATIVDLIMKRFGLKPVIALTIFFILLNFCMIFYFQLVIQEPTYISGKETPTDRMLLNFFNKLIMR